jgi:RNA polymerase sigma factor (sigma-70 family)
MRMGTGLVPYRRRPEASAVPGSFEQFFRVQYPVVVRIAYGVVRDVHLAEDVAQEVLMGAQRRFSEPYSSDHPAAWARIAASHLALNAVRSRERRAERNKQPVSDRLPRGPEDLAIDRDEGSRVRVALSRLPRHSATVLVLRHSGLSYAEVAQAMGVKVGQVGTMLRRAEAALRKELDRAARP